MPNTSESLDSMVQRAPFPVIWNGFKSDTATLRRSGWLISVLTMMCADRDGFEIRLHLKHSEKQMEGFIRAYLDSRYIMSYNMRSTTDMLSHMTFDISEMAPRIDFRVIPTYDNYIYRSHESMPTNGIINIQYNGPSGMISGRGNNLSMNDLIKFEPDYIETPDHLLIEKAEIDDLLSAVLKKQEPKQSEIRERRRLDEQKGKLWTPEKKIILLSS